MEKHSVGDIHGSLGRAALPSPTLQNVSPAGAATM